MADDIMRTLEALGFRWDGEVVFQSARTGAYAAAFDELVALGVVYPCGCTRAEVARLATAPHDGDGEVPYPGTCRDGLSSGKMARAWRFRVPAGRLSFADVIQGEVVADLSACGGDFVVRRADGPFAYQLATVVDDAEAGVTEVVRGADLLSSTSRQILLQRALGFSTPAYAHLPLVVEAGGLKLSKRDAAVSFVAVRNLARDAGPLVASALGLLGNPPPPEYRIASGAELLTWAAISFDRSLVPKGPVPLPVLP